jgi:hypothetical protein
MISWSEFRQEGALCLRLRAAPLPAQSSSTIRTFAPSNL